METRRTPRDLDFSVDETNVLTPVEAAELRRLMDTAFEGDFSEADWSHSLGGTHIIVRVGGRIAAHAAVVPRTIWIGQVPLNAGCIEAVAVLPELQGNGLGTIAMRATDRVMEKFDIGVLSTGEHHFYERLGWERWKGPSWVRSTRGEIRSEEDDDSIMIR